MPGNAGNSPMTQSDVSTTDRPSSSGRRPQLRLLFWVTLLIGLWLFGWFKASQNQTARDDYKSAQEQYRKDYERSEQLCAETAERIEVLSDRAGHERLTRPFLEQELNGGRPFELTPHESIERRYETVWTDPASGQEVTLYFEGDEWTGMSMSGSASWKLKHPRPSQAIYCDTSEQIRKLINGFGPSYWLLCIVLVAGLYIFRIVLRLLGLPQHSAALAPHARLIAECAVAFAAATTVAWLASPAYSVTFDGVTSNDNLVFGTIMLAVGVFALAATAQPRSHALEPPRRPLQFSLKTLLLLTTVFAVALSTAPFGYVATIYLIGAIFLYLSVKRRRMRKAP